MVPRSNHSGVRTLLYTANIDTQIHKLSDKPTDRLVNSICTYVFGRNSEFFVGEVGRMRERYISAESVCGISQDIVQRPIGHPSYYKVTLKMKRRIFGRYYYEAGNSWQYFRRCTFSAFNVRCSVEKRGWAHHSFCRPKGHRCYERCSCPRRPQSWRPTEGRHDVRAPTLTLYLWTMQWRVLD